MSTVTPRRFAVIGDPVAHSKSPLMHAAAYRALDLPHRYERIRATPADLPRLVQDLRSGLYDGFNVTVPHKLRILDYVDVVAPSAMAAEAANTLVRGPDGRVVAQNTDVPALASELTRLAPARTNAEWAASEAIVLGTGGAAHAAVLALSSAIGVATITVRARNPALLAVEARPLVKAEPLAPSARDRTALTIIQATSAGMDGADPGEIVADAIAWNELPPNAVALDVVYAPPETPFLRAAAARGLVHANGLGMLVEQGALAFELWLGIPAPRDVMLAAIR
jgi:shikimate dehydrogenase